MQGEMQGATGAPCKWQTAGTGLRVVTQLPGCVTLQNDSATEEAGGQIAGSSPGVSRHTCVAGEVGAHRSGGAVGARVRRLPALPAQLPAIRK